MATLENYEGSVVLASGITKPEGSPDYPLAEAHDVLVGAGDKRLDVELEEIKAALTGYITEVDNLVGGGL